MTGVFFIGGIILSGMIFLFPGRKSAFLLTSLFILAQAAFTLYISLNRDVTELRYFTFDSLSILFMIIMSVVSAATLIHLPVYINEISNKKRALFLFSFVVLNISLTGVYAANNIIVTWIFIELTTLSAAGLINHNKHITSLEATWKYIFICSVGIALAYIGILFASVSTGSGHTTEMSYKALAESFAGINPIYLKVAFVLILTGYSSKMEVFPLYTIGIDANYVAPAPVSAYISTALVNGGFVAFFRLFEATAGSSAVEWINHLLVLTGILSLLVSAFYMQKANNLKRVFAYSTVEHMGIVLIALSFGKPGIYIALLQITLHSLVKSGLFFQAGILHRVMKSYKLSKTGGYLTLNPAGAVILLTGITLITAIPPSGLFLSEFMLFREMAAGKWLLFWTVAFLLTMIFYGMFNKNLRVLTGSPLHPGNNTVRIGSYEYITQIAFFLLAVTACFFIPGFLSDIFVSVSGIDYHLPFSTLTLK